MSDIISIFAAIAGSALLIRMAWLDYDKREVSDLYQVAFLLLASVSVLSTQDALSGVLIHVCSGLAAFGVGYVINRLGTLGGADVKLNSSIIFWLAGGSDLYLMALVGFTATLIMSSIIFRSISAQNGYVGILSDDVTHMPTNIIRNLSSPELPLMLAIVPAALIGIIGTF